MYKYTRSAITTLSSAESCEGDKMVFDDVAVNLVSI
jgi:hypothetical protein